MKTAFVDKEVYVRAQDVIDMIEEEMSEVDGDEITQRLTLYIFIKKIKNLLLDPHGIGEHG